MGEVTDLAGQHEVIAENLQSDVIKEITFLVKDFKEERKKVKIFTLQTVGNWCTSWLNVSLVHIISILCLLYVG